MNKALLCIGSNKDKEANMVLCHQRLNNIFDKITYSDTSVTAPYGTTYKEDFLNQLAIIYTDKDKEEVIILLKSLEQEIGRTNEDKKMGLVAIDIDLVMWNDTVLKPEDISRHYIADLLSTLE